MATEKTDVVIVGIGAAGGILAAELSKAGMKVIGLERGPRLTTSDFDPHDELRYFQRHDLRPNIRTQPITWRPNANARAMPIPVQNYGNQAGGGTVHYGAVSWRMHEDDFRARSHTIGRYGAGAIPAELFAGRLAAELRRPGAVLRQGRVRDRHIRQGGQLAGPEDRRRQRVRGAATPRISVATALDGSGRHPVRGGDQEARLSPVLNAARDPLARLQGPSRVHLLRLLPSVRLPRGREIKHPRDQASGSRRDRKLQADHWCYGYRVNSDNSGKATGIAYYGPDGSDNTIEADIVILTTFIYDNVRLLCCRRRTVPKRSRKFQRGTGQAPDGTPDAKRARPFTDKHMNNYMGPSAQKHTIDDFNADNFDHKDAGFIQGSQISVGTSNLQGGPISHTTTAPPPGTPRWGAAYRDYLANSFTRQVSMVAQTEDLPYGTRPSTSIQT